VEPPDFEPTERAISTPPCWFGDGKSDTPCQHGKNPRLRPWHRDPVRSSRRGRSAVRPSDAPRGDDGGWSLGAAAPTDRFSYFDVASVASDGQSATVCRWCHYRTSTVVSISLVPYGSESSGSTRVGLDRRDHRCV